MLAEPSRTALVRPPLDALKGRLHGPHGRVLLGAAIALVLLLPVWWLACQMYEGQLLNEQRAHVSGDLTATTHSLEENFYERLAVVTALRASATITRWTVSSSARVDTRGAELLAGIEGISRFWIAPGGTINYVYPVDGNAGALGDNLTYSPLPGFASTVERATQSRQIVFTPSRDLGLEGDDWTAWQAVYQGDRFWGLVGISMDSTRLLRPLIVDDHSTWMEYALRDHDGNMVLGSAGTFVTQPVLHEIDLPGGNWQVAAIPKGGWLASIRDQMVLFQGGSLAILMLLATSIYLVTSRQTQLAQAVADRTREISRINSELQTDIAKRKQAEDERARLLDEMERRVVERTHHLKALYEVASVASASLNLDVILERSLERIVAAVSGDVGFIHLYDGGENALRLAATHNSVGSSCTQQFPAAQLLDSAVIRCWAFDNAELLVVPNTASDPRTAAAFSRLGAQAHVGVPIRGIDRPTGVVCVFRALNRPFNAEEVSLLTAICEHLGVAVENARLYATAQEKAILEERQRLASDLHDSVTQLMYSVTLLAEASRQTLASGNAATADQYLGRLGEAAQQALKEMRLQLYELRYSGLSPEGLATTLQKRLDSVEKRAGLVAEMSVGDIDDLPQSVAEALNRIAQEALNNALKHAAASTVSIEIGRAGDLVEMTIADDGRGFDLKGVQNKGGLGLTTMQERARRLGAILSIESAQGAGTVVRVELGCAGLA